MCIIRLNFWEEKPSSFQLEISSSLLLSHHFDCFALCCLLIWITFRGFWSEPFTFLPYWVDCSHSTIRDLSFSFFFSQNWEAPEDEYIHLIVNSMCIVECFIEWKSYTSTLSSLIAVKEKKSNLLYIHKLLEICQSLKKKPKKPEKQ